MNININTTAVQQVTSDEVDILAKSLCGLKLTLADSEVAQFPVTSITTGSITAVSSDALYKDAKDILSNIGITVTSNYPDKLRILDPNVKSVLLGLGVGSNSVITYTDAASATFTDSFKNNTDIVSFDEFKYFTTLRSANTTDFSGCTNLERLDVNGATNMPNLKNCTKLKYFGGPDSQQGVLDLSNVTSVAANTFDSCDNITTVICGDTINIAANAFLNTSHISKVYFPSISALVSSTFNGDGTGRPFSNGADLYINGQLTTSVTIPSTSTTIRPHTFRGLNITSLTFVDDSVTLINAAAFKDCTQLASITFPQGLKTIATDAFRNCSSLTSIVLPDSITSLQLRCFYYCTNLTSITIKATTPPSPTSNAFGSTNNCPIYVPSGSVEAYKSSWSGLASRIQAIPTT